MNERDKELAKQALTENDWDTYVHIFSDTIRADTMEAVRAANESWTRLAKALVLAEREACAKVIESHGPSLANGMMLAEAIRARGNT